MPMTDYIARQHMMGKTVLSCHREPALLVEDGNIMTKNSLPLQSQMYAAVHKNDVGFIKGGEEL